MKYRRVIFLLLFAPFCAHAESFLSAQTFPKTFSDLSFVERIEVLREGYAPFESEYDKNGVCISGCAYSGITIEENWKRLERNTAEANAKLEQYKLAHPEIVRQIQSAVIDQPVQTPPSQLAYDFKSRQCQPANAAIPVGQTIPYGEPLVGRPRISSRFQKARINPVDGVVRDHTGIDFAAPGGTAIFSPAGGVVEKVFFDSACGNGVVVTHSDEWGTGYCHLSRAIVRKGDRIEAGCKLGEVGSTGRSTGNHLHYIVYRNKEHVNPEQFLGRAN
ncbi:MAG: M23 family metallopeptidase [Rickettsiales bacterium]|jgi:murein DD-endopeptidase MepM/ murein hydrolase activator NlpD|nr:M23 family metallopeptidase [Rickettsiales bacterium]